jgi:hypothetical protein
MSSRTTASSLMLRRWLRRNRGESRHLRESFFLFAHTIIPGEKAWVSQGLRIFRMSSILQESCFYFHTKYSF